jgi:hypothetical protein
MLKFTLVPLLAACACAAPGDPPSNTASEVQGTRLAGSYPEGFATSPGASPYVLDGTITLGGDLRVTAGTTLYVLEGGAIDFAGTGHRLLIDGLLRATGSAAAPVRFTAHPARGYFADGEGFQIVFQGVAYQPQDGSGSWIDHAEITNLAELSDDQERPLNVVGSGIAFDHVKLSVNRGSPLFGHGGLRLAGGAWIILRHCSIDGLSLAIASDLRATPFSVTDSVFRGGDSALELDDVEAPAIGAGQIDGNDLDGQLHATLRGVSGGAAVPAGDNYWAGASGLEFPEVPFIFSDNSGSVSFDFADPAPPLSQSPGGAGPDW